MSGTARRPAEPVTGQVARRGDVPDVAQPVLAGDHRVRAATGVREGLGHPADRGHRAGPHVVRVVASGAVGVERRREGPRDVVDVDEVAPLPAVLEDPRWLAAVEAGDEASRHPGVGRVARQARSVDVVEPQRHRRRPGLARPRGGQVLLRDLRRRIRVPGVEGGVLADQPRAQGSAAHRTRRLELQSLQGFCGPRSWRDHSVLCAGVATLAVDDHRAGLHRLGARRRGRRRAGAPPCRGRCSTRSRPCRRRPRRGRPSPRGGRRRPLPRGPGPAPPCRARRRRRAPRRPADDGPPTRRRGGRPAADCRGRPRRDRRAPRSTPRPSR